MSFIIQKRTWLSISLTNLSIVAFLGMLLRSKILFSIPLLDFKYTLHAHSHFAFGGWVTLAIVTLMIYEVLPRQNRDKNVYKWILAGILINAVGMMISFLVQGYAFFSILFSTLFIIVSYAFAIVFLRDLYRARIRKSVRILCVGGIVYMVISSAGPFTLAYLIARKSANAILYRDAIYTYLHLQYNGFFTLCLFALFFNRVENRLSARSGKLASIFSTLLIASVLPSMFLCYLWHYPGNMIGTIAIAGSVLLCIATIYFLLFFHSSRKNYTTIDPLAKNIAVIAFSAFIAKMLLQSLTVFPAVGNLVFPNRPVIIGFLHLVLLTFITLYLLAHFHLMAFFSNNRLATVGTHLFVISVIINELVLMTQGLGIMLLKSSNLYPILLWGAAVCLFAGSVLLVAARFLPRTQRAYTTDTITSRKTTLLNT